MSPDLESTASFRALCAGVLADKRRIWLKKGLTVSGYDTEYAWQIRTVSYSPVGDEVIMKLLSHNTQHY